MEMGYYQGNEDSPNEGTEFVGKRAVSYTKAVSFPETLTKVLHGFEKFVIAASEKEYTSKC
jgi:hypothetical protein